MKWAEKKGSNSNNNKKKPQKDKSNQERRQKKGTHASQVDVVVRTFVALLSSSHPKGYSK